MALKETAAETGNNSSVIKLTRKKNFHDFPEFYPFPIVRNPDEENAPWTCVIGHLKEHCVVVTEEKDIEMIFTQGFFGKGTFSRSIPQSLEEKFKQRKRLKSKKHSNKSRNNFLSLSVNDEEHEENPAKRRRKGEIEVVLSDTNESTEEESDSSADVTTEKEEKEALQLSLEEAYFLSYGLGVLIVKDKDQPLDLMRLWHKFCDIHPNKNFPVMYTAYHHFRSKGWVVRSGAKYGSDFTLYKDGPPFYHSSYAVIVKPVKEQNLRDISFGGRSNITWSSLAALHRICSHASKAVLILYVIKPSSISENKIITPACVSQFRLEEVLVQRCVPSEERELAS